MPPRRRRPGNPPGKPAVPRQLELFENAGKSFPSTPRPVPKPKPAAPEHARQGSFFFAEPVKRKPTAPPIIVHQFMTDARNRPHYLLIENIGARHSSEKQIGNAIKGEIKYAQKKGYSQIRARVFEDERINRALETAGFKKRTQSTGGRQKEDYLEEWILDIH